MQSMMKNIKPHIMNATRSQVNVESPMLNGEACH